MGQRKEDEYVSFWHCTILPPLNHAMLLAILCKQGFLSIVVRFFASYLVNQCTSYLWGSFWSGPRQADVGVGQGSALSSVLSSNIISSFFLVLHTNGIHDIAIQYCGCDRAIPQYIQLLHHGFYPAFQFTIKTCVMFALLNLLHKLALTTKASAYDFYRALEKLTVNTGSVIPKQCYQPLMCMVLQWRHLKILKWGGRTHNVTSVEGTQASELAVLCPLCSQKRVNLPVGWNDMPPKLR